MLSFRDIVATRDDADVLRASLAELSQRRHAKQQEAREQEWRERNLSLDQEVNSWGTLQEIAYRRDVLNTWARQYPMLREAVAHLVTASSNATATASSLTAPTKFSVAQTVRRPYPPIWQILAGTVPSEFYAHNAAVDVSRRLPTPPAPLLPVPRPQPATTVAMQDCSADSCLVRILWEAVQATDIPVSPQPSSYLLHPSHPPGSSRHVQTTPQRVLARWPRGKPASAKAAAVLRSIGIEERKREKWSRHVRVQQQRDEVRHDRSATSAIASERLTTSVDSAESSTKAMVEDESYSALSGVTPGVACDSANGGGGTTDAAENALGHELYWPAYITRVRALFTGAVCLQDTFQGLGELQGYDEFEPVLALALVSPLRIVVDVVFAIDETSEAIGLSIDPVVHIDPTSSGADMSLSTSRENGGLQRASVVSGRGSSMGTRDHLTPGRRSPPPLDTASAMATDKYPVLLPSSLPQVLSDLNYAFTMESTTGAAAGPASGGNGDLRHTASQGKYSAGDLTTASAAVLRRSALSNNPIPLYTILAGPVSQTHSIVLLRPTPELVCAARARALQELEKRWLRLREALAGRLVAYEDQTPTMVAVQSHAAATTPPPATPTPTPAPSTPLMTDTATTTGALLSHWSLQLPSYVISMRVPDVDTPARPLIDCSARQDEGPPAKPAGAKSLTEEEMRCQTRLPQQQNRIVSSGRRQRFILLPPSLCVSHPADPDLGGDQRAHSQPSSRKQSPRGGTGARGDGEGAAAAPTAPAAPRSMHTRGADRGARYINDTSTYGDDHFDTHSSGPKRTSAPIEPHREAMVLHTPLDSISPCSPPSSDGRNMRSAHGSSSHLDLLHSGPSSEYHWTSTTEKGPLPAAVRVTTKSLQSMEVADCAKKPSPLPTHGLRLSREINRVGSAAAADVVGSAFLPSTLPPSLRSRPNHSGPPIDANETAQLSRRGSEAVADSPHSRTCSGGGAYSAILSASAPSIPESHPMSALREASMTANLFWDTRNTSNDTANPLRNTGGGGGGDDEHAHTLAGRIRAAPSTLSLHANESTTVHPPHTSRLEEERTLIIPNLSFLTTTDTRGNTGGSSSTTTVTQCSAMSSPAFPPSHAASPLSKQNRVSDAVTQPYAKHDSHTLSGVGCLASLQLHAHLSLAEQDSSRSSTTDVATKRSVTQPPVQSPGLPPQHTPRLSNGDVGSATLDHTRRPNNEVLVDGKKSEDALGDVPRRSSTHFEAYAAPHATASASSPSSSNSGVLSGTAAYSERCPTSSPSAPVPLRDQQRLQLRNLEHDQRLQSPRRTLLQQGPDINASSKARSGASGAALAPQPSNRVVVIEIDPQPDPHYSRHRSLDAGRPASGWHRERSPPIQSNAHWLGTTASATNSAVPHGGSSSSSSSTGGGWDSSGQGTGGHSPLPRRPQSPAPSLTAPSMKDDAPEAVPHRTSAGSKPTLSSPVRMQPYSQYLNSACTMDPGTGGKGDRHVLVVAMDDRAGYSSQRQQRFPDSGSVDVSRSVLVGSVNHEVELPGPPVCVEEAPTPHPPPPQELQSCFNAANASAAVSASAGELATDLDRLSEYMRINPSGKREAHRGTTVCTPRPTGSGAAYSTHHSSRDVQQESPASSSPSTLSSTTSLSPSPRRPYAMPRQVRPVRRKREKRRSTEKYDAANAVNPAASPCDAHDAPHTTTCQSPRRGCGFDRGDFAAPVMKRGSSSERHYRDHHHDVSPSPQSSSTHKHMVLVRRVVRRRRSEVFVEEGGKLVHRAPMTVLHPTPNGGRQD
ncbi:hypothetical protein JKF63_07414 [Porcisia hertigi]|uniref:Uncharacterized protein n=1 Tax=Porcisia hertigi TaxID=2761500 RepID=A0A836LKW6_9TRYP|nr:hypothetical protein JKF63_07414 [Porcisia hertigi]